MEVITWQTPLGPLWAPLEGGKPAALRWGEAPAAARVTNGHPLHKALMLYFNNIKQKFDISMFNLRATPFRQRVWKTLCEVPYGQTVTYGQLAEKLGTSPRAVGNAVGANPLPLFIPCHRVMGANGALTGFSAPGGLATKRWLLQHEGVVVNG